MLITTIGYWIGALVFSCIIIPVRKSKGPKIRYLMSIIFVVFFSYFAQNPINYYIYSRQHGLINGLFWLSFSLMVIYTIIMVIYALKRQWPEERTADFFGREIVYSKNDIAGILLVFVPLVVCSLVFSIHGKTSQLSLFSIISFVVFAPLVEEVAFRFFLPKLRQQNSSIRFYDYLVFSLVFAFCHFFDNGKLLVFATSFLFSLYCYLLEKIAKKTLFPFAFHAGYNLLILYYSITII